MTDMLDARQAQLQSAPAPAPTIPDAMANTLTTRSEWLAAHPPAGLRATLARVAQRAAAGEDFHHAVREFLGEYALRSDDRSRVEAISERPAPSGEPRFDAYLGALAEHLAAVDDLLRPGWSIEPERFLACFWFVSEVAGFRAVAIAQAPAAFRRRGIFIPERSLHRV